MECIFANCGACPIAGNYVFGLDMHGQVITSLRYLFKWVKMLVNCHINMCIGFGNKGGIGSIWCIEPIYWMLGTQPLGY